MNNITQKPIYSLLIGAFTMALLAGCIVQVDANATSKKGIADGGNFSSVNKSLTVKSGQTIGNASSVNGSLTIGDNVQANKITSVNGRLRVGENVTATKLSSVNGKLSADEGLNVSEEVTTVNGKIQLSKNSEIGGKVATVNGTIELKNVDVGGNVETINGNINLLDNTIVDGDIVFGNKNSKNYYNGPDPILSIESGSNVKGDIILRRPVDLEIEDEDLRSKVVIEY
ncbi:hypothetical protein [Glaciecola petra]|uniref:Lipoprotein n=1 Tax=Glaciecola petra TaxID=3075602 RepID=A0ABU2ZY31_9ALTE|nr:hypothetical protein [Aestuariibacter sp. P117]MDT0596317.1 hypothetical protein [Aestuariibacter sp. P117]